MLSELSAVRFAGIDESNRMPSGLQVIGWLLGSFLACGTDDESRYRPGDPPEESQQGHQDNVATPLIQDGQRRQEDAQQNSPTTHVPSPLLNIQTLWFFRS